MRRFSAFPRFLRLLLIGLGPFLLLLVALLVAGRVPAVREYALHWAESGLSQGTGHEARIGRVDVRLWPGRLVLYDVRIASGPRLADGTLLAVDSIRLGWSWRAVLRRTLLVNRILLVRPRLTLPPGLMPPLTFAEWLALFRDGGSMTLGGLQVNVRRIAVEDGAATWETNDAASGLEGLQGVVERRDVDGRASVAGTLHASRLFVSLGGTAKEVTQLALRAEATPQILTITAAEGVSAGTRITGKGQILDRGGAAELALDLGLSSPLTALLKHAGVSREVDGRLTAEATLRGPWARPVLQGTGRLQFRKTSGAHEPTVFHLRWADGRLEVETPPTDRPTALWSRLVLEPATGTYQARLKMRETDLGELTGIPALAARLIGFTLPAEFGGRLTADVDLTGRGGDLATLRGHGTLRADDLSVEAGLPPGRLEANLVATASRLTLQTFVVDVPGGTVRGSGRLTFADGQVDLPIQADIRSVGALGRGFGLSGLGGNATLTGRMLGTRESPRFQGHLTWREPRIGTRAFDRIEGDIEWLHRTLRSSRLLVLLGQSVVTLQGSATPSGTASLRALDWRRDLSLDIHGQVSPGRTADLAEFLPTGFGVHGTFRAGGWIAGTPETPTGEVEVAFTELQTYGEGWRRGGARLRLVPGALEVTQISLRRGRERVEGELRIGADGAVKGRLTGAAVDFGRLRALAGSQVTGRGFLQLDLQGSSDALRVGGQAKAEAFEFQRVPFGPVEATFSFERDAFALDLALRDGSHRLRLNLGPPPGRLLRLDLALSEADLTPLLRLAEVEIPRLTQAKGSGRVMMQGPADNFRAGAGEASLSRLGLRYAGENWENRSPVELAWQGRAATLRQMQLQSGDGEADLQGTIGEPDQTALRLKGRFPLVALQGLPSAIRPLGGSVTTDLDIRGSLTLPDLHGLLEIAHGRLHLEGFPAPFEDLQATVDLQGERTVIRALRGKLAGGDFRAAGEAVRKEREWSLELTFQEDQGRAEQLLVESSSIRTGVTGSLDAKGSLASRGRGEEGFWRNLDGNLTLVMRDGQIGRQTLMAKLLALINLARLLDPKGVGLGAEGTPYERLDADIKIERGVARTRNLRLESRAAKVTAVGQADLADETVELDVAVKPFQTLDTIVTNIPLAGWLLGGKDKSLIVAYYQVSGPLRDPKVTPRPLKSLGRDLFGVFRNLLELPEAITGPFEDLPPQKVKPQEGEGR